MHPHCDTIRKQFVTARLRALLICLLFSRNSFTVKKRPLCQDPFELQKIIVVQRLMTMWIVLRRSHAVKVVRSSGEVELSLDIYAASSNPTLARPFILINLLFNLPKTVRVNHLFFGVRRVSCWSLTFKSTTIIVERYLFDRFKPPPFIPNKSKSESLLIARQQNICQLSCAAFYWRELIFVYIAFNWLGINMEHQALFKQRTGFLAERLTCKEFFRVIIAFR